MRSVILVLAVALVHAGVTVGLDWSHSKILSTGFTLQWRYDEDAIDMQISAPTRGWVGIGFGIGPTMAGADLIIGGVRSEKPYVWDCYARRNGPPTIDLEQNVQVLDGAENATHTRITVKRPLTSNNVFDQAITSEKIILLWAFGSIDKDKAWNLQDYHQQNRGSVELVLLAGQDIPINTDSSVSMSSSTTKPDPPSPTTIMETVTTRAPQTIRMTSRIQMKSTTQPFPTRSEASRQFISSDQYVTDGFPFAAALDESSSVVFLWDFDDTAITMQLIAPTMGWIGLGFSRSASMNGADIIMMGVTADKVYAVDCHSDRNGVPDVDEEQNVEIVTGWENGTHTGVTIRRNRLTCNDDDMDIWPSTYKVIWAYGSTDLQDDELSFRYYHRANRGGRSLKLINPVDFRTAEELTKEQHLDIGPTDYLVPAEKTHYLCKYIKMVDANETIYVTGFEPFFTKGNMKNIHHATIYICDVDVTKEDLQKDYRCYSQIHPFSVGCNKILGGWAVGSTGLQFPENSGFAVGSRNHPQYVIIEMHYDNPEQREFLDSSGLRLSYVKEKPEILTSLFDVSQTISTIFIPPGAKRYRVDGYCTEKCINKGMEKSGLSEIKVFGIFFHSHLAGKAIRLRHFRDGKELQAMARDEHYDFNYQETQYFEEPKTLKLGDSLTLECDYGTLDRKVVTPGGLPTTSEMCIAFLFHYPPLDMSICGHRAKIFEDPSVVIKLAAGLNITLNPMEVVKAGNEMRVNYWRAMGIFAEKILPGVEWTDEKRKFVQELTDNVTLYTTCIAERDYLVNFYDEFHYSRTGDYVNKAPICLLSESPAETMSSGQILTSVAGVSVLVMLILGAVQFLNKKT